MNAAFLLMSTAALAGADPAPAAPAAPAVISTGHGCNNCSPAASCCPKTGLLDKIKARLGSWKHKSHECGCAPAPAPAPAACCDKVGLLDKIKARLGSWKHKSHDCAPAPAPCHTCAKSVADRPNLLDKLKARLGHNKGCGCAPACDPCASAPAHTAPPATVGTTPKEMPKPKDPPKADPKPKGNVGIPAPLPSVTGASGTSPY